MPFFIKKLTIFIEISGAFFRAMNRTLDYLVTTQDVKEVTRAAEYLKLDYKGEGIDMNLISGQAGHT